MLAWMKQFILILGILGTSTAYDDDLVVTPSGPIRGTTVQGFTGKEVQVFYGIPYAEPPIGQLRFGAPVEIKPWTKELDATVRSLACYQKIPSQYKKNIAALKEWVPMRPWAEDCVKLHIWVPKPRPKNAAVMVYIHGGGFGAGDPEQPLIAGATLAAEENIITVSMNYRLDVLGFLYLGIPEAPGNVGILDQQMALKWIRKNIASFGGNPNDVTIQGISAGGASVGYHLLAPSSGGLFRNAIMMSGTANAEYAIKSKEKTLANSLDLARAVGCTSSNLSEVHQCLQLVHPEHFLEWNPGAFSLDNNSLGLGPTVDGHFLPDFPNNLLRQGLVNDANVMIGLTAKDGASFLFTFFPQIFSAHPDGRVTPQEFQDMISSTFQSYGDTTVRALAFLSTNWTHPDDPYLLRDGFRDLLTDVYFNCPAQEFADLYAATGNAVYRYVVDYEFPANVFPDWSKPNHGMDTVLHLGVAAAEGPASIPEDVELSKRVMKWWANFARTGNPNSENEISVTWPRTTVDKKEYTSIDVESTHRTHHRTRECAFLNTIVTSLGHRQ